jgi:hypothetical protein
MEIHKTKKAKITATSCLHFQSLNLLSTCWIFVALSAHVVLLPSPCCLQCPAVFSHNPFYPCFWGDWTGFWGSQSAGMVRQNTVIACGNSLQMKERPSDLVFVKSMIDTFAVMFDMPWEEEKILLCQYARSLCCYDKEIYTPWPQSSVKKAVKRQTIGWKTI